MFVFYLKLLGLFQHLFHQFLAEAVLALAVDVEVGRALNSDFNPQFEVLVDTGLHGRIQHHVLLELFHVQADLLGHFHKDGITQFAAMGSQGIAEFPELALLLGGDRGGRSSRGIGMEAQGERRLLI